MSWDSILEIVEKNPNEPYHCQVDVSKVELVNWEDPCFLKSLVEDDQKIVIHKSESQNLDFTAKNFSYEHAMDLF